MKFGTKDGSSDGTVRVNKRSIGSLRRAQFITTFGPGALLDLPKDSVILGATDYWDCEKPLSEPRLATLLGVMNFKQTKVSSDMRKDPGVVGAFRFPYMYYCPSCGRLDKYWNIGKGEDKRKCAWCDKDLVPSRFVAACENGHIEDFPYSWWVHRGRPCDHEDLRIEFSKKTGSLSGITVTCKSCGAKRNLEGATNVDALAKMRCRGHMPWINRADECEKGEGCSGHLRVLQRGASNVYYSITASALTIPNATCPVIDDAWEQICVLWGTLDSNPSMRTQLIENMYGKQLRDAGYTVPDALSYIENRIGGGIQSRNHLDIRDIYEDEYRALNAPDQDTRNFKTAHEGVPEGFEDYIEDVVLVSRLREVVALRGFTRVSPIDSDLDDTGEEERRIMPPYARKQNWLPAVELLGEGVFIRLKADAVERWASRAGSRYGTMAANLIRSLIRCDNFSPAYVLLHTLSHVLIRQLSIDCGYSSASMKERIYSTFHDSDAEMYGVLVYASSSDSDGSLGGACAPGPQRPFGCDPW